MAIFLDTGKVEEVEQFHKLGIIRGVTTNPTILYRSGVKKVLKDCSRDIARVIAPYPLSVEVTTNDRQKMFDQAKEFSSWAENIVVKITVHGPEGELDNLEVVHELETRHNIRVNVTAMMSAQQCFLAAMAGATYVSMFGGRVNNMGYNVVEEIKKLSKLLEDFKLKSKIILGSTREVLNVVEWLHAGAHIVTVLPNLLKGMIIHPYTKETVKMFLDDAAKAEEELLKDERIKSETLRI
ncbi:MAG: transaldolase [Candidatus Omnitrophica bacterium]|nr:transaldolase [Candidatus Omnitrophota bacterium]MBU2251072.1 transaldolase [Candidatus Omnitrophota bacterium]MBU2266405.1 transaldolase [Candidatus Omnitrophota bacterium]